MGSADLGLMQHLMRCGGQSQHARSCGLVVDDSADLAALLRNTGSVKPSHSGAKCCFRSLVSVVLGLNRVQVLGQLRYIRGGGGGELS